MDSQNSILPEELSNFMSQTGTNFHCNHPDYRQKAFQRYEKLFERFDFEKYVEVVLSENAKICEAMATEKFLKDAYDNLLNMECPSTSEINDEDAEESRKATEKFLEESYNNMLHMFDGVSETTEGKKCSRAKEESFSAVNDSPYQQPPQVKDDQLLNAPVDFKEDF